jgi:hypothetical protein
MKKIPLTQGYVAIVDDEDYEKVAQYKWQFHGDHDLPYASTSIRNEDGNMQRILLHRFLTSPPRNMVVDHIDGNPLNNRRANLRICTQAENCANHNNKQRLYKSGHADSETGYRCIVFLHGKKMFRVRIGNRHFGDFEAIRDAVQAYNDAATMLYGSTAQLQTVRTQGASIQETDGDRRVRNTRKDGWAKSGQRYIYTYPYITGFGVVIRRGGRQIRIGTFKTLDEAISARDEAIK